MSQNLLLLMNGTLSEVLIQLRIGDLDSLNHVNNANYLTFFEIGRVDFLIKLIKIFDPKDVNFVVKHAEIEFKKPIHFTDKPVVQTWISKIGNMLKEAQMGRKAKKNRLTLRQSSTLQ